MQIIATTALMAFFILSSNTSAEVSQITPEMASPEPVQEVLEVHSVALTGYNAVPEQTDADPSMTASGAYSNPEIVAARSVDLADELPFGTVIEFTIAETGTKAPCGLSSVNHLVGYRVIADSMHPRKRNQIDIMFDTQDSVRIGGKKMNPAVVLGVCKNIEIRVVGHIDIKKMPRNQMELQLAFGTAALAIRK